MIELKFRKPMADHDLMYWPKPQIPLLEHDEAMFLGIPNQPCEGVLKIATKRFVGSIVCQLDTSDESHYKWPMKVKKQEFHGLFMELAQRLEKNFGIVPNTGIHEIFIKVEVE